MDQFPKLKGTSTRSRVCEADVGNEKDENKSCNWATKPSTPKTDQDWISPYNISVKVKPTGEENKEKHHLMNT